MVRHPCEAAHTTGSKGGVHGVGGVAYRWNTTAGERNHALSLTVLPPRCHRRCVGERALLLIAFGRLPGFPPNRAAVAASGAGFMVALQRQGAQALWRSIDGPVLVLLFSVMVVTPPSRTPMHSGS